MSYSARVPMESTWLDECYKSGRCIKFSELERLAVSARFSTRHGLDRVTREIASIRKGVVELSGAPGSGKTTRFPYQLGCETGDRVLVVMPNPLMATAAHHSAVQMRLGEPSLYVSKVLPMQNVNGTGRVIYTTAARMCDMLVSGQFITSIRVVIDEAMSSAMEVVACKKSCSAMAVYNQVIHVSTQTVAERLKSEIRVEPIYGSPDELAREIKGKSTVRFFSNAIECRAAAAKAKVPALTGGSDILEYNRALSCIANGGMVYADTAISSSINLNPDAVITANRKVALVVKDDKVVATTVPVAPMDTWQQVNRLARNGNAGVAYCNEPVIVTEQNKNLDAGVEGAISDFLFHQLCGGKADSKLRKLIQSSIGDAKIFLDLVSNDAEWRINKFGVEAEKVGPKVRFKEDDVVGNDATSLAVYGKPPEYEREDPKEGRIVKIQLSDGITYRDPSFWHLCMVKHGDSVDARDHLIDIDEVFSSDSAYAQMIISKRAQEVLLDKIISTRNYIFASINRSSETGTNITKSSKSEKVMALGRLSRYYEQVNLVVGKDLLTYSVGVSSVKVQGRRLYPFGGTKTMVWAPKIST